MTLEELKAAEEAAMREYEQNPSEEGFADLLWIGIESALAERENRE